MSAPGAPSLRTVSVPPNMTTAFARAEELVARWFADRRELPERGTIELGGERYVLVRAAGLSVDFFTLVRKLFGADREREADAFALHILFDLAHALGKSDAKVFTERTGVTDPIARLSAGPVHFAHSGWAFVEILPESRPTPDDDYFLLFDHPYSFESDAWARAGQRAPTAICIMNAGYSSGWCEESFGLPLVTAELTCRARGDERCRFVMAPPHRIEEHMARLGERLGRAEPPRIPAFFARKRIEEELRATREELELRVRERTDALRREMTSRQDAERRLLQAHQLDALGRLAGGVAHDFNNLMAVVLANASRLASSFAPQDERRALIDEILTVGARASDLTSQLLAFGRGPAEARGPLDAQRVISELARLLTRLLGDDIALRLALAPEAAFVLADRARLEQIIVNLAVNARDAMPSGGELHIGVDVVALSAPERGRLGLGAGPARYVRLSVRDTGVGMDDATRAAMFDPYFTTKAAGTGVGLSTVQSIVRDAQGAIEVASSPGRGARVIVYLPATPAPAATAPAPAAAAPAPARRLTILLVEDQEPLRRALALALGELGHDVTAVADAPTALELARGRAFELLVSDIMLARGNGEELAATLLAEQPALRVVLMSGRSTASSLVRSGVVAMLPKPFTVEALEACVAGLWPA